MPQWWAAWVVVDFQIGDSRVARGGRRFPHWRHGPVVDVKINDHLKPM